MHPEHPQSQPADSTSTVGSFGFHFTVAAVPGGRRRSASSAKHSAHTVFFSPRPGRFNREVNETHLLKERLPFHWLWPRRDAETG